MAKKKGSQRKGATRKTKAEKSQNKQMWAVVLFAVGLLTVAVVFFKENIFHKLLFGLLGWSSYFVPPLLIYVAVMAAKDKPIKIIKTKLWQSGVLLLLISGTIGVFRGLPKSRSIPNLMFKLYKEGMEGIGGGALSVFFAAPLNALGRSPIPQIIIVLALFVFIMLVTGNTLLTLYYAVAKPVQKAGESYSQRVEQRKEEQRLEAERSRKVQEIEEAMEEKQKVYETIPSEKTKFNIDIDISDDMAPEEFQMSDKPLEPITKDLAGASLDKPLGDEYVFVQSQEEKDEIIEEPPQEIDSVVDHIPAGEKFKDMAYWKNTPEEEPPQEKPEENLEDTLDNFEIDLPVEHLYLKEEPEVEEIEPEEAPQVRPHPLHDEIDEVVGEDILRVVKNYLDRSDTGELYDTGPIYEQYSDEPPIDDEQEYYQPEPEEDYLDQDDEDVEVETIRSNYTQPVRHLTSIGQDPASGKVIPLYPEPFSAPIEEMDMSSEEDNTQHSSDLDEPEKSQEEQPPAKQETEKPQPKPVAKTETQKSEKESDRYQLPPLRLLEMPDGKKTGDSSAELSDNANKLVETLESFGVKTKVVNISQGPTVTRYELQPSPGVKISRITGLADDIALNLAASGIRIEAPIPGKAAVGVEVPNKKTSIVRIRELIDSPSFKQSKANIGIAMGKDITGQGIIADISRMPHMLIAGATGSGKSVCINAIIMSILYKYTPEQVKLLMIDPKVVELGVYNGIPHLLVPVVTDPKKASGALSWAVTEMGKRYNLFAEVGVRDIKGYNALVDKDGEIEHMPQIVIIIDELADLMMAAPNEVEDSICRLAQLARAAGMHLVIATQRPSVDVITGVIKSNITTRVAFAVSSHVDSRTILDEGGAEKLLGNGDMLFHPMNEAKPIRLQGCYVSEKEVQNVVDFIKTDQKADYDEDVADEIDRLASPEVPGFDGGGFDDEDELIPYAIELVVDAEQASTSMLQRRLRLGYARAARIIDQLEARGIVGPFEGSRPREVLIDKDTYLEMKLAGHDQPNAGKPLDELESAKDDDNGNDDDSQNKEA